MKLIEDILQYRSVSVAGMAKNVGKTVCLNFILRHLPCDGRRFAVTSIGLDGESRDQVTGTHKPEITIRAGMYYVTTETHFRQCAPASEILDISERQTALGRLVFARALVSGKVMLSGPGDTATLRRCLDRLQQLGVNTTLVDGALSRKSFSAPTVTDALVLATGAALTPSVPELVHRTKFVYDLIALPEAPEKWRSELLAWQGDNAAFNDDATRIVDLGRSAAAVRKAGGKGLEAERNVFISGAVTDSCLAGVFGASGAQDKALVCRDFTKFFVDPMRFYSAQRAGGRFMVLDKPRLIAVCVNPTSPTGYRLHSDELSQAISAKIPVPVYDLVQYEKKIS